MHFQHTVHFNFSYSIGQRHTSGLLDVLLSFSELLTDEWMCHPLLLWHLLPPRDSRTTQRKTDGDRDGVKESLSLMKWYNLSRGPMYLYLFPSTYLFSMVTQSFTNHSETFAFWQSRLSSSLSLIVLEEWHMPQQLYMLMHTDKGRLDWSLL